MIDKALNFVQEYLNQEINLTHGVKNNVILSGLVNLDGSVSENIENKIILNVINLEHETTIKSHRNFTRNESDGFSKSSRSVNLNLYLLVAANYNASNYNEALKMLSTVIGVFQNQPYFEKSNFPSMESPVEKLSFEIYNLPINELSHIWSGIGAKYVPSLIYKVRMITIDESSNVEFIPETTGVQGDLNPKS